MERGEVSMTRAWEWTQRAGNADGQEAAMERHAGSHILIVMSTAGCPDVMHMSCFALL